MFGDYFQILHGSLAMQLRQMEDCHSHKQFLWNIPVKELKIGLHGEVIFSDRVYLHLEIKP